MFTVISITCFPFAMELEVGLVFFPRACQSLFYELSNQFQSRLSFTLSPVISIPFPFFHIYFHFFFFHLLSCFVYFHFCNIPPTPFLYTISISLLYPSPLSSLLLLLHVLQPPFNNLFPLPLSLFFHLPASIRLLPPFFSFNCSTVPLPLFLSASFPLLIPPLHIFFSIFFSSFHPSPLLLFFSFLHSRILPLSPFLSFPLLSSPFHFISLLLSSYRFSQ